MTKKVLGVLIIDNNHNHVHKHYIYVCVCVYESECWELNLIYIVYTSYSLTLYIICTSLVC